MFKSGSRLSHTQISVGLTTLSMSLQTQLKEHIQAIASMTFTLGTTITPPPSHLDKKEPL